MRTRTSYYGTAGASPPYSDGDIYNVINNNQVNNLNYAMKLVNDSLRYLTTRYFWNEESITMDTVAGVQFYPLPAQLEKLINVTVLIGNVLWQPYECSSRQMWDALNVIQFYQDYPYYYFIYGGQIGIWPTPTTSGEVITVNYKSRITDLTMDDVTDVNTGYTLALTNGSTAVLATGSGTAPFVAWMANKVNSGVALGQVTGLVTGTTVYYSDLGDTEVDIQTGTEISFTDVGGYTGITAGTTPYWLGNTTTSQTSIYSDQARTNIVTLSGSGTALFQVYYDEIAQPAGSGSQLRIPFTSSNATCGDNQWYPIATVVNGTTAYLSQPYQGQTVSGASFTIGQTPLLIEDYQDLPLYRMGSIYYTVRTPDAQKAQAFTALYNEGFERLDNQFSNKSTNISLSDLNQPMVNPNLYVPKIT